MTIDRMNRDVPRVSVLMTVYNAEPFLRESIDSLMAQTFPDWELIAIENGSTDASPTILDAYSDHRIRVFRFSKNIGRTPALRYAFDQARGEFIAVLDADDVSRLDRLMRQVTFLDLHQEIALVGSWAHFIDGKGKVFAEFKPPSNQEELHDCLGWFNPVVHSSVMFRRELAREVGGYPECFAYAQDFALILALARHSKIAMIDDFLCQFRVLTTSTTGSEKYQALIAQERLNLWHVAELLPLSRKSRRLNQRAQAIAEIKLAVATLKSGSFPAGLKLLVAGLVRAPSALWANGPVRRLFGGNMSFLEKLPPNSGAQFRQTGAAEPKDTLTFDNRWQAEKYANRLRLTQSASNSVGTNNVIVALLVAEAILATTIFSAAQIVVELVLLGILFFKLTQLKLSLTDFVLLAVLVFSQIISFMLNDLHVFMLNAKIFTLAILVFIYFKHVHFVTPLISVLFYLNALLVIHQVVTGDFIIKDPWFLEQWRDIYTSRPIGLFLSPHFSAGFAAVYLLYLASKRKLYFIDFVFLFYVRSLFNLTAYAAQIFSRIKLFSIMIKKVNPSFLLVFVILSVVFLQDLIIEFATTWGLRDYSVKIIVAQIVDPAFYKGIFTLYPTDIYSFIHSQQANFADVGNEVGYITTFVQGGFLLALTVFIIFVRHLRHYQVYILVSMLHNGFLVNLPLILYMMVTYNDEIEMAKRSECIKKYIRRSLRSAGMPQTLPSTVLPSSRCQS